MKAFVLAAIGGLGIFGGALEDPVSHNGNMTSTTELALFKHRYEIRLEPYRSRGEDLLEDAAVAPAAIGAGVWEDDSATSVCEPKGKEYGAGTRVLQETAADVWAQALAGFVTGDELYYARVRESLLEYADTRGFGREDGGNPFSGSNQCVLDLSVATFHLVEAALLLENVGYAEWGLPERQAFHAWLVDEVFDLVSWPIDARKNNWGILGIGSAAAIATYVDFCTPLMDWNDKRWSPAGYLDAAFGKVWAWASPVIHLDSTCAEIAQRVGYQVSGALPDEQRRGPGNDVAECRASQIAELCSSATSCNSGHLYSLKTLNGLVRIAELLRRQGDSRLFDDELGEGANLRTIYDYVTGGEGTFDRYHVLQEFSSLAYVLAHYYPATPAMRNVRFESGTSTRGGRDYAYGSITHSSGIR